MARNTATAFTNEVISYGGLPLRRGDVYAVCFEDTGSKRAADLFAFGRQTRPLACEPMTIEEFRAVTAEVAA